MELTMSAFSSLSKEEMTVIDGGGWTEFGQALVGTLLIGLAPAVGAAAGVATSPVGGVFAFGGMISIGCSLIGAAAH